MKNDTKQNPGHGLVLAIIGSVMFWMGVVVGSLL